MQPYSELAADVACESNIAVMILANPECTDVEFVSLKPRPMPESEWDALRARWRGRDLQSIGVVGIKGTTPLCAFKEPLEPEIVSRLAGAFLEYVHVLLCDGFVEQVARVEVDELRRVWELPDTRPEV